MQSPTNQISSEEERRVQRAIVLQLLRSDRDAGWTRAQLAAELADTDPSAVADALAQLRDAGVLHVLDGVDGVDDASVRCSRSTLHLDELELIAI